MFNALIGNIGQSCISIINHSPRTAFVRGNGGHGGYFFRVSGVTSPKIPAMPSPYSIACMACSGDTHFEANTDANNARPRHVEGSLKRSVV
jgi:hypothetical protein